MSQKSDVRSINGSFTFKGEEAYSIADEFYDWCKKMEEQYEVTVMFNRTDYSGYLPAPVDKKD